MRTWLAVALLESVALSGCAAGAIHALPGTVAGDSTFQAGAASVVAWFITLETSASGGAGNSRRVGDDMTDVVVCAKEPLVDRTLTISPPS